MAYVSEENRLRTDDVFACCTQYAMETKDYGPCGMGVDVQDKDLYVVIGKKIKGERKKVVWVGTVPEFSDLYDLINRFNVKTSAVCYQPQTRKAREFQAGAYSIGCKTYLILYRDILKEGEKLDDMTGVVSIARTEVLDKSHMDIINQVYQFPRWSPQIQEYAKQMTNIIKVLVEDKIRKTMIYRYIKVGNKQDHYRHATNYFDLAVRELEIAPDDPVRHMLHTLGNIQKKEYDPLWYGLN
jgi:hypothetical protein